MSYSIPDSITAKVQSIASSENKKKKYSDLYSNLDKINNKFVLNEQTNLPKNVTLEKMEFSKPNSEEIKQTSEALLADYKNNGIQNIENDFKLKYDTLNSNKQSAIAQTESTKNSLGKYYENAKNQASMEASKRGLNRSSIIVNQLNAFSDAEINDYKQLDEKLSNQINAINFEINALSSQKESALNSFNISYAVKLQEKIDSLNSKLEAREQEVIKYNNEIALKEAEFNNSVEEAKQKFEDGNFSKDVNLVEIYAKYGMGVVDKVKQDQLINVAKQFLLNLPQNEREELLSDETFKNKMGASFNKLISELNK